MVHKTVQEQLEKSQVKYKKRHDPHHVDHSFQVGDEASLHISKERLLGEGKKLKPIQYGPFIILENIGNNYFRMDFPSYMKIYAIVNVENLRSYEPPLIEYQGYNAHIPSIEYFSPKYHEELQQDIILDRKIGTSNRGNVE